jgi:hypothetical protein
MRMIALASASAAVVVAITLFDLTPTEAAYVARRSTARTVTRAPTIRRAPQRSVQHVRPQRHVRSNRPQRHVQSHVLQKHTKSSTALTNKGSSKFVQKGGNLHALTGSGVGKASLRTKLPHIHAVANSPGRRGRVGIPQNLRPRVTLLRGPRGNMGNRLRPFVQRYWKRSFFWVAIAGFGYLTIPEDYYDPFLEFVNADEPDYEGAVGLLSLAAVRDEDEDRVRYPMPADVGYRYKVGVAPIQREGRLSCQLELFVERKWNRPFSWVLIPKVGNITAPDDYYDRFYTFVAADPPDYPAACAVLVEAAATDTVAVAEQAEEP